MEICIQCGSERKKGRRLCRECHLKLQRERAKIRYLKYGRYNYGKGKCIKCGCEITLHKKNQKFCKKCVNFSTSSYGNVTNKYLRGGGNGYSFYHRRIAEEVLNRKLKSHEVVHHIDEDIFNNSLNNLMILTRSQHTKLHRFLQIQRAILEQSNIRNIENCWNTLIVLMTTTWLEMTNVNVLKLSEIGQSAAEHL